METISSSKSSTRSHPLLTMLLFGTMMAGLIGAGSYVSKQRSTARVVEKDLGGAITFFDATR